MTKEEKEDFQERYKAAFLSGDQGALMLMQDEEDDMREGELAATVLRDAPREEARALRKEDRKAARKPRPGNGPE